MTPSLVPLPHSSGEGDRCSREPVARRPRYRAWLVILSLGNAGLLFAIGAFAVHTTRSMMYASDSILAENVSSLRVVARLEQGLLAQKGLMTRFLLDRNERWLVALEVEREGFEREWERALEVSYTPEERVALEAIYAWYRDYDAARAEIHDALHLGASLDALLPRVDAMWAAIDATCDGCEQLLGINEALIEGTSGENRRRVALLGFGVWGGIAFLVAFGAAATWFVWRGALRRVLETERLAVVGHLALSLAHEVRNPLAAMGLRLDSLRGEGALSGSAQEDLEVVQLEVDRLMRLVRNYHDFVRLPPPRRERLAIEGLLRHALEWLEPVFRHGGIAVAFQAEASLPRVEGDRDQLRQVFLNLLGNATQAMPEGGSLTVCLRSIEGLGARGAAGAIAVTVRDSGPGVPPALRGRIFDPFSTSKQHGLGLGLYLARRIVEQHRGTIDVADGAPGAVVTVTLPASGKES